MTFGNILSSIYARIGSTVPTRTKVFVNEAHRTILGAPGMERLRDDTLTFVSVNGKTTYGLSPDIARIKAISERTNMRRLRYLSLDALREQDPGLQLTGVPDHWVPLGYQAVQTQPAAATGLWVVSSNAADTTQAVGFETERTGGYRSLTAAAAGNTLNGTTRVALLPTSGAQQTDHIAVNKWFLDGATTGSISLYDAATSGNELARLEPGQTSGRYQVIQLYPTPTGTVTYYVDYTRVVRDMTEDGDEPFLPEDFHYLLILGGLRREYEHSDDSRVVQARAAELEGLKALRYWVHSLPDYFPSRLRRPVERNRFGGTYPNGSGW